MIQRPLAAPRPRLLLLTFCLAGLCGGSAASADTRFAVIGDYGSTTAATNVASHVIQSNPLFITTVGDNIYQVAATTTDFDNHIGIKYGSYIKSTASAVLTASTNGFYPSLGNHDIDAGPTAVGSDPNFALNYRNYFDLTHANDPAISASSGSELYYDVVRGPVHLFVLSADTRDTTSGQAVGSAERNWYNAQMAASTSTWNIIIFHQPAYSTAGLNSSTDQFSNAYMQWGFAGAQVIYNGHSHDYERTLVGTQQYVVEGTGGQSLGQFQAPAYAGPSPLTIDRIGTNQQPGINNNGFTLVDCDTRYLTSKHFTQNGNLLDKFTVLAPGVAAAQARSFKQNVSGYTNAHNKELRENGTATSASAASLDISYDTDIGTAGNQRSQVLLRFDSIFGAGGSQIPLGAKITSATLKVNVTGSGSGLEIHRMLSTWNDSTAAWSDYGANGVLTNDVMAASVYDEIAGVGTNAANINVLTWTFDVSKSLQAWSDGAPNNGWLMNYLAGGIDGVDFDAVNGTTPPQLDVEFIAAVPEPGTLAVFTLGAAFLIRRRRFPV